VSVKRLHNRLIPGVGNQSRLYQSLLQIIYNTYNFQFEYSSGTATTTNQPIRGEAGDRVIAICSLWQSNITLTSTGLTWTLLNSYGVGSGSWLDRTMEVYVTTLPDNTPRELNVYRPSSTSGTIHFYTVRGLNTIVDGSYTTNESGAATSATFGPFDTTVAGGIAFGACLVGDSATVTIGAASPWATYEQSTTYHSKESFWTGALVIPESGTGAIPQTALSWSVSHAWKYYQWAWKNSNVQTPVFDYLANDAQRIIATEVFT
jgi:hypothetical protein